MDQFENEKELLEAYRKTRKTKIGDRQISSILYKKAEDCKKALLKEVTDLSKETSNALKHVMAIPTWISCKPMQKTASFYSSDCKPHEGIVSKKGLKVVSLYKINCKLYKKGGEPMRVDPKKIHRFVNIISRNSKRKGICMKTAGVSVEEVLHYSKNKNVIENLLTRWVKSGDTHPWTAKLSANGSITIVKGDKGTHYLKVESSAPDFAVDVKRVRFAMVKDKDVIYTLRSYLRSKVQELFIKASARNNDALAMLLSLTTGLKVDYRPDGFSHINHSQGFARPLVAIPTSVEAYNIFVRMQGSTPSEYMRFWAKHNESPSWAHHFNKSSARYDKSLGSHKWDKFMHKESNPVVYLNESFYNRDYKPGMGLNHCKPVDNPSRYPGYYKTLNPQFTQHLCKSKRNITRGKIYALDTSKYGHLVILRKRIPTKRCEMRVNCHICKPSPMYLPRSIYTQGGTQNPDDDKNNEGKLDFRKRNYSVSYVVKASDPKPVLKKVVHRSPVNKERVKQTLKSMQYGQDGMVFCTPLIKINA